MALSVRSPGGAVLARRRIPAVAVGERGAWTLLARWARGTYTVSGRAYDVAGRRQAEDSRATLVVRGSAVTQASAPIESRGLRR